MGIDELFARIRAALRRASPEPPAPEVRTASFTVDLSAKRVLRDGEAVRLTPTEWHLLEILAQLRRKLEAEPGRPRHLITEEGVGYRLEP